VPADHEIMPPESVISARAVWLNHSGKQAQLPAFC
jgi:hypothetical protein